MISGERYITGWEILQWVDDHGEEAAVDGLQGVAPDSARYLIEFPLGDVYTKPGLDLRSRKTTTIAALIALGNVVPRLKIHIATGLSVGLTQEKITEVITQVAVYTGLPAAFSGLFIAKAVFAAH